MRIEFVKYQGTGNDFIMLNNMNGEYDGLTVSEIQFLCDRKIGIGADGLIKISKSTDFDFDVDYFNSDGSKSFCGNGARCSVSFANALGIISNDTQFSAIDGVHSASISNGQVRLEMLPVSNFVKEGNDYVMDTGSPHFIRFVDDFNSVDIIEFGKEVRYSDRYKEDGINVNVVCVDGEHNIKVKTYERGVEDETLSCGTGVTAAALSFMDKVNSYGKVSVETKGGKLSVEGSSSNGIGFENIWLSGPAKKVFDGVVEI